MLYIGICLSFTTEVSYVETILHSSILQQIRDLVLILSYRHNHS